MMNIDEQLRNILATPKDETAHLIYVDWCEENGKQASFGTSGCEPYDDYDRCHPIT
ncbi:MAG: hypothetical protein ACFCD0_21795 [Gemmataceae bacterium]